MQIFNTDGNGVQTVIGVPDIPTTAELKQIGKPYTQNGIVYQVPLTKDTQDTVVAVAVAFQMGGITTTVLEFENGVIMPVSQADFTAFATWFAAERNTFFAGAV